jgi:broad specificity phosphatase PhoE
MEQNAEVATVPVDLNAPDLVEALASDLPLNEKGELVRAALARQGATLLDLRDAQRGLQRPKRTAEQRAASRSRLEQAAREAEAFYARRR